MTVIVACPAPDGTLVFGADRQFTSKDEICDGAKLSYCPFPNGRALIGMAADDVNRGFARKFDLLQALLQLDSDRDPVDAIRNKMRLSGTSGPGQSSDIQILCGIGSSALEVPRLILITDTEVLDLHQNRFCCIGSGNGAAHSFMERVKKHLLKLSDIQIAVCASIWAGKADR
jgi:hypothetical protein